MNIIITGSSGFIASTFLELYGSKFEKCFVLGRSKNENLKKYTNVIQKRWSLEDTIDIKTPPNTVFIHTAYDNSNLNNNLKGIKNVFDFIKIKKIKRLIYLSSFSVYNPFNQGVVSEKSPYTKLKDPYSYIKIKIENKINTYSKNRSYNTSIIVLQPSIVYGLYGNWSMHAIKTIYANKIELPTDGICNPVYVNDVAESIFLSTQSKIKIGVEKYIISSNEEITWTQFYEYHNILKENTTEKLYIEVKNIPFRTFHDKWLINLIYSLLFSRIGVYTTSLLMPLLRKFKKINKNNSIKDLIQEGKELNVFTPIGMNRIVHNSKFTISSKKAMNHLKFNSKYTIQKTLKGLKNNLNNDY